MKVHFVLTTFMSVGVLLSSNLFAQTKFQAASAKASNQRQQEVSPKNLYIDVHHLGAGKVTAKDVEAAHQKDLGTQQKYGVSLIKYWFDETNGDVYCLSSSPNVESIRNTHAEAHGLLPDEVYQVTAGQEEIIKGNNNLYLDVHELGAGKVSAKNVAEAHKQDLAVQRKHGVNLINYWVDEKKGVVMCLAQAPNADSLIGTHKEAHGLVPIKVVKVEQGQ